jgi:hypothetical protein
MALHDPRSFMVAGLMAANIYCDEDWRRFRDSIYSVARQEVKLGLFCLSVYVDRSYAEDSHSMMSATVLAIAEDLALDGTVQILRQKRPKPEMLQMQEMVTRIPRWLKMNTRLLDCMWLMFAPASGIWHPLRVYQYAAAIGGTRELEARAPYRLSSVCALEQCGTYEPLPVDMGPDDVEQKLQDGAFGSDSVDPHAYFLFGRREQHNEWLSEMYDLAIPWWLARRFFLEDVPPARQWLIEKNRLCDSYFAYWTRTYDPENCKSLFLPFNHWFLYWSRAGKERTVGSLARASQQAPVRAVTLESEAQLREHAQLVAEMWEVEHWHQPAVNIRKLQVSMLDEEQGRRYMKMCVEQAVGRARVRDKFISDHSTPEASPVDGNHT